MTDQIQFFCLDRDFVKFLSPVYLPEKAERSDRHDLQFLCE
jgi:hypothetical protein